MPRAKTAAAAEIFSTSRRVVFIARRESYYPGHQQNSRI
jgi:hypothetical protein